MLAPFNWLLRWRSWRADRVHERVTDRFDRVRKVAMRSDDGSWRVGGDLWAEDGFHPNRNGHALWADTIYPVLDAAIAEAVALRDSAG